MKTLIETNSLELRLTHKYNASYPSGDTWVSAGAYATVAYKVYPSQESEGGHEFHILYVMPSPTLVEDTRATIGELLSPEHWVSDNERNRLETLQKLSPEDHVRLALRETFSYHGCACPGDCCGCRSQGVRNIRKLGNGLWALSLYFSFNY